MGMTDRPVLDLIHKVRSWISGAFSGESLMSVSPDLSICFECQGAAAAGQGHRCRSCGRLFCRNCMQTDQTTLPKFCRFCYRAIGGREEAKGGSVERFDSGLSPSSLHFSNCRIYDEDDGDERGRHYLSPMSEVSPDYSDIDANSVCTSHEFYSFKSSPLDSPSRAGDQGDTIPILDRETQSYCRENTEDSVRSYDNLVVRHDYETQKAQLPLDFENSRIWYPPRLEDEEGVETAFFPYDEEDDYVSDSSEAFSSAVFSEDDLMVKEKPNDANKEHLTSSFHGHFRALVADLLKVHVGSENGGEGWLDIVSSLAWQAATYVKPDTSKGCSNDPGDYVKVKCISSGSRSDSMLIKGVVCTKNIKHKHMVSQHRNPRLLILGGALEYQKVSNKLASISTVLEEEREHLKMVVSKIEAHRPNVLLVEKGVSSYAQQYLAKEISLVLNVKRTLLERISRCTGAQIAPSIDNLGSVRLGQCEMFQIVKVPEECSSPSYPSKKSAKTLMFFVGCPRRLGCTVLLKGARLEVLKMVKHVIRLASFAAYHLSRETSFLADEGASLPKIPLKSAMVISGRVASANTCFLQSTSPAIPNMLEANAYEHNKLDKALGINTDQEEDGYCNFKSTQNVSLGGYECSTSGFKCKEPGDPSQCQADARTEKGGFVENSLANTCHLRAANEEKVNGMDDRNNIPHQSILVSFSSSCILKGSVCEPSRVFCIKFYGTSDKPLGRYLRDDLFDPSSCCRSCKEPAESHVRSYIHQQGSLTISVKRLPSIKLPGERDGRIWMWHRCLKCERNDGVPPAAHRVAMSDAAWGLSFGKFLELSFSNHATANRIASCGHSLQRDCLRFYGFGSMVAYFRYSCVDILSVQLPSLKLDFVWDIQQEWVRREAASISDKVEFLHDEVSNLLYDLERSVTASKHEPLKTSIHDHISDLRDLLKRERREYDVLLDSATTESTQPSQTPADILELNRLRRCLLIDSFTWDRRLHLLDSVSKGKISSTSMVDPQLSDTLTHSKLREWSDETFCIESGSVGTSTDSLLPKHHGVTTSMKVLECNTNNLVEMDLSIESVEGYVGPAGLNLLSGQGCRWDEKQIGAELEGITVSVNNLSDNIDLLWTGSGQPPSSSPSNAEADSVESPTPMGNSRYRKLISPIRVYSFDSALRYQNKASGSSSPHFSSLKSLRLSGDFVKDPIQNLRQAYTQRSLRATRSLNFLSNQMPSRATSEGARFLLPQPRLDKIVILVYDNDPTSIISYAISSLEHANFIAGNSDRCEGSSESISCFHDDLQSQCYGPDEPQQLLGNLYIDPKESHFRISFEDDSSSHTDKVKFSVTCYCARQFDALRKRFCPNEVDFIRSLSRCKTWKAQGGKSNVYFAKSLDERFIIKQVTKTELDSFEEFAPEYFKYFTESISSGSPTCLAKVLGIYQVNIKHLKGGREVKMDLMVMENLFFQRNISKVYDLKGSSRARYNPDTSGNKVLLDSNLLETLRTKPIYLGIMEKRKLERAVWNDTSFLANIDVMDYSLLVGVDEEKKELVVGIIDFMRQYTWDKHLETWVKASGILGGPKNESPTVVSPDQYKKRFRKAMTSYFQALPEKWTS